MNKSVRLLSLFSGIGAFEKALEKQNIPYELVGFSEIDAYAIESYCTLHNTSQDKNLGDIAELESLEHLKSKVDLVVGGSPCFKKGTLITTKEGFKKIEDIEIGDEVLTHTNTFKAVVTPMTNYAKDIFKLKVQGSPVTFVTGEHPYYVREMKKVWDNKLRRYSRVFDHPKWKEVKEIKKDDFIGFPINTLESNPRRLNEEQCWLLGRYVADGHLNHLKRKDRKNSYHYQVVYSIGSDKIDTFRNIVKDTHFSYYPHSQSTYRCVVSSQELLNLIRDIGLGETAINKRIPKEIQNLPKVLLSKFLDGYMSGDGCFTNGKYKATSISKELIFGLGEVVVKLYEVPYSIYFTERPKTTMIEGRVVNQKDTWEITFQKDIRKQQNSIVINGILWQRFKSKELIKGFEDTVYNFEVEEDNSYVANGCIVHNCQDFSIAGRQQGSIYTCLDCNKEFNPLTIRFNNRDTCPFCKSVNLQKTRSSLLIEYLRAIREVRPKYFVYENVKNVMGKSFISGFNLFIKEMNDYGYDIYYDILDSAKFGVPQQRQRVFVVGIQRDLKQNFIFSQGKKYDIRLKDILEDEVAERFYYDKDQIAPLIGNLVGTTLESVEGLECIGNLALNGHDYLKRVYSPNGLSPTVTTCAGGNTEPKVLISSTDEIQEDMQVRKLTPLECWRLMGFEDKDYYSAKSQLETLFYNGRPRANSQLYKQAGNSIVVNVLESILKELLK